MNRQQELWWMQARSDHDVLILLRRNSAPACHQLHYIQMVTEKLAKAYFWRSGTPPARSHAGFVMMMRLLGSVRRAERKQVAAAFQFARYEDFQRWTSAALPLIHRLERIVP
ncbi:MAG TPA: hypothetical protein VMP01_19600, partial [Pirellulaceae bacterium]|nr:hypothetical protein [Pirellulaceae bacterium]